MAASNNSSVSSKLLDAITNDDMEAWQPLISANPKVFDLAVWPENPLILACKLRRFAFILVIGNIKPELALQKIQDGTTVLHLSCIYGDDKMVRALVGLHFDQLYYVKDRELSMIPLHKAVLHGRVDVISLLLSACPDSIGELTSENQTVFHLAADYCNPDAFAVLLGEAKKLNKEYLLDAQDCRGNAVLHIAVQNKQLRIVKMCFPDLTSTTTTGYGFTIRVNAKNMKGETALDLYDKMPEPDYETRHIDFILREAIQREVSLSYDPGLHHHHPKWSSTIPPWRTLETKNVLLVVLAIFIGLAFTLTCSLPTFFTKEYLAAIALVFELKDLVNGKFPLIFYIMSFITVLLTTSTFILSVLLYSLPCGSLMLLGGFATFFLYLLLAYFVMPKFSVKVGSRRRLSSYYLMLILAISFILIGSLIIHLGNCLISRFYNYAKCVTNKVLSKFWSPSKKRLPIRSPSFKIQMSQVGLEMLS